MSRAGTMKGGRRGSRTWVRLYTFRVCINPENRTENGPESWGVSRYFPKVEDAKRFAAQAQCIHGARWVLVYVGAECLGSFGESGRWTDWAETAVCR